MIPFLNVSMNVPETCAAWSCGHIHHPRRSLQDCRQRHGQASDCTLRPSPSLLLLVWLAVSCFSKRFDFGGFVCCARMEILRSVGQFILGLVIAGTVDFQGLLL